MYWSFINKSHKKDLDYKVLYDDNILCILRLFYIIDIFFSILDNYLIIGFEKYAINISFIFLIC